MKSIFLLLIFVSVFISTGADGQTFWGVTSNDGAYRGGAIFSYNATTSSYTDQYIFKPSPVFGASNIFEQSSNVYIGVCDRSYETTIYGSREGNSIFRYNAVSGETEILAELPFYFHSQNSGNPPGDIIFYNGDEIVGMVILPNDSLGVIRYSISGDSYEIVARFNAQSYPAEGVFSYSANNCYFSEVDASTIVFSLKKKKGDAEGSSTNEGRDFFTLNTQTNSVSELLNVPYVWGHNIPYGPFVKTNDNRLFCQLNDGFMELNVSAQSFTIYNPFEDDERGEDGELLVATDSTLLGRLDYSVSDYLFEYNYKTNSVIAKYNCGNDNNINSYVVLGDSVYFSDYTYEQYRIQSYKPGSGTPPVVSFKLTEPKQGYIKYLVKSSATESVLSLHSGLSEFYPDKRAYVNLVRFEGNVAFYGYKDGATPESDLLLASNGKLYGMAVNGGRGTYYYGDGVLFEFDPSTMQYSKLLDFTGENGGFGSKNSYGTLYGKGQNNLVEYNEKLYGTTYTNGVFEHTGPGAGVIFTYDISRGYDNYRLIYDFNDSLNFSTGMLPMSGLTRGSDNKLYGTTSWGGIGGDSGYGVLYSIDPAMNDTFEIVIKFPDTCSVHPIDDLVLADNGKMYGVADAMSDGYWEKKWAIREYDVVNKTFTNIYVTDVNNHEKIYSGLLNSAGKLYGMVNSSSDGGYLFEYDIATQQLVKKVIFVNSKGIDPMGNLTLSSTGNIWGMTFEGGDDGSGVIFEYDPQSDSYTKHHDFVSPGGRHPVYSCLTEVDEGSTSIRDDRPNRFNVYPNPTASFVSIELDSQDVQDIRYSIFDMSGNQVMAGDASVSGSVVVDLSTLAKGVYVVNVTSKNRTYTHKIVKN